MNRSHTAPSSIWVSSLPEESKLKLILTFLFSAMYLSPMAVRDSVREAAANTVSSTDSSFFLPSLLPQATRLRAMTSARSREISFFIVVFPF